MSNRPVTPTSNDAARYRTHLVDTTMLWSERGGGVARYLRGKRRWLREHTDWRHTILVPARAGAETHALAAAALPISGGYRFPLSRSAAARAIAALEPDVIEVGDPYRLAWAALDAAWQRGVPVTLFCHSNLAGLAEHYAGTTASRAVRRYLRRLYAQFDAVFAASQWMVGELRDLDLDNVVYQPLGVDTRAFHPRLRDHCWRAELGIARDAFVLIYAGRYAPEKNLKLLADAAGRLGPGFVLVTIGAGPCPPVGERVLRLPYQSDVAALARALASADLFVHAGDQETFGLAALEALACGTPVVARACAGATDILDGTSALGVKTASADAYAAAISSMRARAHELRAAARRRALRFDSNQVFDRLLRRYRTLRAAVSFDECEPREQQYVA